MFFEIASVVIGLVLLVLIRAGRLSTQFSGVGVVLVVAPAVFGLLTIVG